MMSYELAGLALFFGHVGRLPNPLQLLQFGFVEPGKNIPIRRGAGVPTVPHQNFQPEIAAESYEPSVGFTASPDPGCYNAYKCHGRGQRCPSAITSALPLAQPNPCTQKRQRGEYGRAGEGRCSPQQSVPNPGSDALRVFELQRQ